MKILRRLQVTPVKYLPAVLGLSVLLRAAAALALGNEVTALPGTADQVSYHALALRVAAGEGFTFAKNWWPMTAAGAPTAHWSYLYTLFLAGVYSLAELPLVPRILQAVIVGVLQPYLAFLLGTRVFSPLAGLLAAGFTAFYTYFVYYAATLMTEPFYITAILGVLYLAIRRADSEDQAQSRSLALALGALLGATVLLRQLFLLFVPFLLAWLWFAGRKRSPGSFWSTAAAAIAVMVLFILPATVHNYQKFGRFVLVNTNAGFAFYLANHPSYGTDFIPAREMTDYQALVPGELRSLDEAALDQALLARGLLFVRDDPIRYLLLSLDRVPEYFRFWPSADSGTLSNFSRVSAFGLALPFIAAGIWLWARERRGDSLQAVLRRPETLLLTFALIYTGIHVLSWALVRYRLPVDAVLLVFAGRALQAGIERIAPAQPVLRPATP